MNIDFIEWMCEKAEGFSINKDLVLRFIDTEWNEDGVYWQLLEGTIYYPLLLQRAIEGANKKEIAEIAQNIEGIEVFTEAMNSIRVFAFNYYDSIDKAKESALKYIWEQVKK